MSDCAKKCKKENGFYGTTTLGERGQVVIPAKARKDFKLEKGEQLLVFGIGKNMIALVKVEQVKEFAAHLSKKLKLIKSILKRIT
ncbi:hypothetical protein HRbin34_00383 [bacterium HR34]|nr:hypothetical protein HRbin34_00383 [bacterium HR34]